MENQNPSLRIGLLDNSHHSLKRGYEMWSLWKKTDDPWLLKESIIWVHHGIELALKQLLAQTNAFLVFENVDAAIENLGKLRKRNGMEKAGVIDLFDNSDKVKSVGFQNLIERVAVALSIPELEKNALLRQKIDELTQYRNKVVHFSIELDIPVISNLLSDILDPLLSMLEREVKDDNFIRNRIPEIREIAQPVKVFSEQFRQEIVANAIKATENALAPKGNRRAGIVSQTIGSGLGRTLIDYLVQVRKLSKIKDNHIIIVTDSVNLTTQIHYLLSSAVFQDNIAQVNLPGSGIELTEALNAQTPKVIISTIQKLTKNSIESNKEVLLVGYNLHGFSNLLPGIFPNATYILFTSVPLQRDSLSWLFFGDLVGKYDLAQAINDGVALPIKIESRKIAGATDFTALAQDETNNYLATSFNSRLLTVEYITRLSKDITNHFSSSQISFKGKGIILVPNIAIGAAFSETIANTQHESKFAEKAITISSMTNSVEREELITRFKNQDDPFCLLIATGGFPLHFDNPLVYIVYVTSPISLQLRHELAQLISRPHKGKKEAVIVDYVGLDWELDILS